MFSKSRSFSLGKNLEKIFTVNFFQFKYRAKAFQLIYERLIKPRKVNPYNYTSWTKNCVYHIHIYCPYFWFNAYLTSFHIITLFELLPQLINIISNQPLAGMLVIIIWNSLSSIIEVNHIQMSDSQRWKTYFRDFTKNHNFLGAINIKIF